MSVECREPGPEGPQDWSAGPGGHAWASGSGRCPRSTTPAPWSLPRWRAIVAAAVLCYINLLNYMNWFIIAGEEADGPPGQRLLMHVCAALLPAGTANPLWPPVLQTFFLWNASLLFSCLEVVSAMPAGGRAYQVRSAIPN